MRNALSFDVEEWFQAETFARIFPRESWEGMESRVEPQTDRILALLDRYGVRATFFMLGWVAERHPELARRIARAGHELACHGYGHVMITRQGREEFLNDVRRARTILEETVETAVQGYRAPTFSVTQKTRWALDLLLEEGFRYDSSVYPIRHDRYGIPGSPRFPHVILEREGRRLWELPGPVIRVGPAVLPAAGGGYLRLLPYRWTRGAISSARRAGEPANVFAHPWEFDVDLPGTALPFLSRIRHYGGISGSIRKLERLLSEFRFVPLREIIDMKERGERGAQG